MRSLIAHPLSRYRKRKLDYSLLSLPQLAERIFACGDRQALKELHDNRPLFRCGTADGLLMAELKESDIAFRRCGCDSMVLEHAYDLTLGKFLNIPSDENNVPESTETDGPDCRYYYRAFYSYVAAGFETRPPSSSIDAELRAAEALQRMVTRHFYLSCLECKRRALKLVRRYIWELDGRRLCVWLPIEMPGKRCRTWLEANILDVCPCRPGERDRVQAIVDRLLGRRTIFSLDELHMNAGDLAAESYSLPTLIEEEISVNGLASAVAQEKVDTIEYQHPKIRALGRDTLARLIRSIFEALADDRFRADRIARAFNLSKATFSRFAGNKWACGRRGGVEVIPDLWRNTAHVLANHSGFVTAAKRAGVWDQVRGALYSEVKDQGQ